MVQRALAMEPYVDELAQGYRLTASADRFSSIGPIEWTAFQEAVQVDWTILFSFDYATPSSTADAFLNPQLLICQHAMGPPLKLISCQP